MAEYTPERKDEDFSITVQTDIVVHLARYRLISHVQKVRLMKYLLRLDKSNRLDLNSEKSKNILKGIHEIVEQICQKIKQRDRRFSGNLVPMGSAHNHTKLGELDELDFVHELTIPALLRDRGTFNRYIYASGLDNVCVDFNGDPDDDLCKPFNEVPNLASSSSESTVRQMMLDLRRIRTLYFDTLLKVIPELELPPGWCHGGIHRPNFSVIREHGKAFLLQFDYLDACEEVPLRLSLDFVPMIRIPLPTDINREPFSEFITEVTGVQHSWVSLQSGFIIHHSNAEERWLDQYLADSVAKTLMRICKAVCVLSKMNSPKCPELIEIFSYIAFVQNGAHAYPLKTYKKRLMLMYDTDDYVTYSDLGETVGNNCLLRSYDIKLQVMKMMMSSEAHGRNWIEDDLPDLVITVFKSLLHYPMEYTGRFYGYGKIVQHEFYVNLEEKPEINEDIKCSGEFQTENCPTDAILKCTEATTDIGLLNSIIEKYRIYKSISDVLLYGGISSIFQLLRAVWEGHSTAQIVRYKTIPPEKYWPRCVTKEEFKEIMHTQHVSVHNYTQSLTHNGTETDTHIGPETDTRIDKTKIHAWRTKYTESSKQSQIYIFTPKEIHIDTRTDAHLDTETDTHINTETDTHIDIETDTHIDTETDAHIDTETDTHIDTETDTHIDTETDTHIDTETDTHIDTETDTHIDTETDTHITTETDTHIDTETDTHIDTETDRHIGTETDTHIDTETDAHIDTETDTHIDTETDTHIITETDTQIDTETDTHINTETDTHIDTETDTHIDSETDTH